METLSFRLRAPGITDTIPHGPFGSSASEIMALGSGSGDDDPSRHRIFALFEERPAQTD